jgi:aminomethyltransferase
MPPPPGYDALRQKAAWLDLSTRGKIKMLGEDRVRLLHAMTTNHIQQLTPGSGCYAYFLNAQGRILADVNVLCRPEYLLLDTEPETREKVVKHLDQFIIADDVTLEDASDNLSAFALEGPQAESILRALGAPIPAANYANELWDRVLVARLSYSGADGFRLYGPDLATTLTTAGAEPATLEAFEIVRIEHGKPRYGADLSERFLSQEANQPQALSFTKGCYLGQEIVERVRSRGQVHRVLVSLEIDTAQPPEPGTKLQEHGAAVAEITSAAYSPALDKSVALAYVRTDRSAPGTELYFDTATARVR